MRDQTVNLETHDLSQVVELSFTPHLTRTQLKLLQHLCNVSIGIPPVKRTCMLIGFSRNSN